MTRNGWTTITESDPSATRRLVERLESNPPSRFGTTNVVHSDRPAPDVFRFWTEDDTRVALRPSGTEPKLKHYCEAIVHVGDPHGGDDAAAVAAAREIAERRLDAVVADVHSLITP